MSLTQTPEPPPKDLFLELAQGNVAGFTFVGLPFSATAITAGS